MIKVITYGTYDLLHEGHIRLLKRAKELGDYLIVGVTGDSFDKERGKINVQQSLMERIEAVKATGIADEIIIEEYLGQKIDDIKRLDVDIFTVGSDWKGHFDYLNEYCKVVYLERTKGISSTDLRSVKAKINIGLVGESGIINKFERECHYVNGVKVSGIYAKNLSQLADAIQCTQFVTDDFSALLRSSDAIYIASHPSLHYTHIKQALLRGKHVLCESPIAMSQGKWEELREIAEERNLILEDALKTAYSTAYYRLLLLIKSGRIGKVVSIDAVCTSLSDLESKKDLDLSNTWNSFTAWAPTALLPVFQILGTDYVNKHVVSYAMENHEDFDLFTNISFVYPKSVASVKVGKGVKSEGHLIIAGTKGYVYVPAPWWKTDYFEIRFENSSDNQRFFYQLDGEGIRYEIINFIKSIQGKGTNQYISNSISLGIVKEMESFFAGNKFLIKL
ncbi:Gfo/Idh/MocA family oxidoreductase [Prevotella fusca]